MLYLSNGADLIFQRHFQRVEESEAQLVYLLNVYMTSWIVIIPIDLSL